MAAGTADAIWGALATPVRQLSFHAMFAGREIMIALPPEDQTVVPRWLLRRGASRSKAWPRTGASVRCGPFAEGLAPLPDAVAQRTGRGPDPRGRRRNGRHQRRVNARRAAPPTPPA
ncbi:hypothetical protein [Falsiroseomonas sp.]|uniref:hypothetical protein n=1 Tax=Falsiroseomonas sp. TaxID=2870721 RepID=UPI003F71560F